HKAPAMSNAAPEIRTMFSRNLRETRKAAGFRSARAFAERLDIDENRYTRYERAEVEPSLDLLVRICRKLKTSPNALLDFADTTHDQREERVIRRTSTPIGSGADDGQSYVQPGGRALMTGGSQIGFGVTGLAEASNLAPSADDAAVTRTSAQLESAAWSLAQQIARLEAGLTDPQTPLGFDDLATAAHAYRAIVARPFEFAADLAMQPAIASATAAQKAEIATGLSAVIAAAQSA
ncbi:MAG: helix-turn-helix transcriptional regulator, partial [Pseudomonadota bacterium]